MDKKRAKKRVCPGVKDYPVNIVADGHHHFTFGCFRCGRVFRISTRERVRTPKHYVVNHGGPRNGSGAPVKDIKKVSVSFKLDREVVEYLRGGLPGDVSQAVFIERAVRELRERIAAENPA